MTCRRPPSACVQLPSMIGRASHDAAGPAATTRSKTSPRSHFEVGRTADGGSSGGRRNDHATLPRSSYAPSSRPPSACGPRPTRPRTQPRRTRAGTGRPVADGSTPECREPAASGSSANQRGAPAGGSDRGRGGGGYSGDVGRTARAASPRELMCELGVVEYERQRRRSPRPRREAGRRVTRASGGSLPLCSGRQRVMTNARSARASPAARRPARCGADQAAAAGASVLRGREHRDEVCQLLRCRPGDARLRHPAKPECSPSPDQRVERLRLRLRRGRLLGGSFIATSSPCSTRSEMVSPSMKRSRDAVHRGLGSEASPRTCSSSPGASSDPPPLGERAQHGVELASARRELYRSRPTAAVVGLADDPGRQARSRDVRMFEPMPGSASARSV
jgi:hypothetical protein